MIDWFFRIHSWNRIVLTGLAVAPAVKAIIATLTVGHMIALPICAAVYWVLGWAAIGGWSVLQRRWQHLRPLDAADTPVASGG